MNKGYIIVFTLPGRMVTTVYARAESPEQAVSVAVGQLSVNDYRRLMEIRAVALEDMQVVKL